MYYIVKNIDNVEIISLYLESKKLKESFLILYYIAINTQE